jgi:hypothetical protein
MEALDEFWHVKTCSLRWHDISTAPRVDPSKFLVPGRGTMGHDNNITNFRQIGKILRGVISVDQSYSVYRKAAFTGSFRRIQPEFATEL